MRGKRLITTLIVAAMILICAGTVYAAGTRKVIQLVDKANPSGGISKQDHVYLGKKDETNYTWTDETPYWRVLDANKMNTDDAGMFLLSENLIGNNPGYVDGNVIFNTEYGGGYNIYPGSVAQNWCNDFLLNVFSPEEREAIASVVKSDAAYLDYSSYNNILNGDKVFFLSAEEADNNEYGFTDDISRIAKYGKDPKWWWLRSPHKNYYINLVGIITKEGKYSNVSYSSGYAARPAFNLDMSAVLFTSAAEGGKTSSTEGLNCLVQVGENVGTEWKMTLKDDGSIKGLEGHKDFTAAVIPTCDEKILSIKYNGAAKETNGYISAIIINSSNTVTYYGRLTAVTDVSGTVKINIDGKLGTGDTLYVFNEQYNGDKTSDNPAKTDYASSLQKIEFPTLVDHDWEFKGFEWTGDATKGYTKAIAKYECKNDSSHKETVELTPFSKETKPTCTNSGKTTYSVTVKASNSLDKKEHSESKDAKAMKATGHSWGEWKITKEPTETTAGEKQRVCRNDSAHIEKEIIPVKKSESNPTPETESKPTTETEPKSEVKNVSGTPLAKMTAKGKKSLKITWLKVDGAEGYDIFFAACGKNDKKTKCKLVKTITGNSKFSWTKSKLKAKKAYKAYVKAWVMENGKKKYVGTSPTVHAFTSNGTKTQTNAKSVVVEKTKISVKKGKTKKIKVVSVEKVKSKLTLMSKSHAAKLRYLSTNKKIATVSKSGKIRGISKGSCYVYVYAHNGVSKRITVTVK